VSDQKPVDYTLDNLTLLKLIVILCGKYICDKHQYILELPDSIPRFLQEWLLEFEYVIDKDQMRRYRLKLRRNAPKRWPDRNKNKPTDPKEFSGIV